MNNFRFFHQNEKPSLFREVSFLKGSLRYKWEPLYKGRPFCLKPFSWSAFLYFGLMLQTRKTQRMLQIFDKSLEFEWKIFEIFIILFSFYISSLLKSNGKSILKFISFFIMYFQPKGGILTTSRRLLFPHPWVNDFLI